MFIKLCLIEIEAFTAAEGRRKNLPSNPLFKEAVLPVTADKGAEAEEVRTSTPPGLSTKWRLIVRWNSLFRRINLPISILTKLLKRRLSPRDTSSLRPFKML